MYFGTHFFLYYIHLVNMSDFRLGSDRGNNSFFPEKAGYRFPSSQQTCNPWELQSVLGSQIGRVRETFYMQHTSQACCGYGHAFMKCLCFLLPLPLFAK